MSVIFWRVALIIGMVLAGVYAGALAALLLVPKNAGLAGGAMVLFHVVLGALVFAVIGVIIALKLKDQALRKTSRFIGVPVLILTLVLSAIAISKTLANREPDSAFAPAGQFTATMERLDTSDPYLFVKMEIDSKKRTWTQTGPPPDNEVFYAKMQAATLVEIRQALDKVAAMDADILADCHSDQGRADRRLRWQLMDADIPLDGPGMVSSGAVNINAACLKNHFILSRALQLVEKASMAPGGKVKRR